MYECLHVCLNYELIMSFAVQTFCLHDPKMKDVPRETGVYLNPYPGTRKGIH